MAQRPKRKPRYTKEQLIEACKGCFGINANVYRKLGIGRRTWYQYRQKWPEVQQAVDDELQQGLDFAENQLMTLIQAGDYKAIAFYLERRGAERGWGPGKQQVELTQPPVQPIICFHDTKPEPEKGSDEQDDREKA